MKKFAVVLLAVLLLVSCRQEELAIEDRLQFEIQKPNEQELEQLSNNASNFTEQEIEQYYAVIVFDYQILNGNKFNKLTVNHDFDWGAFMDDIELDYGTMYMNGESSLSNFNNGSFKQEILRFIFYAKDFSREQLESIFETYKLHISWQKKNDGEIIEKTIQIGDYLQDKR
ncbi:hypothetical protein MKY51_07775 [Solibacillus sp. FSL R5-0691]|uniref:hypothetical protein n=1 Tax=Solibacillus sp. FSL R5-0691 TaxID=2921653 RepID=UPI0030D43C65